MIIIIGTFKVAAADREAFLASRVESIARSRTEEGCITYTMGPDPIDPEVIVLTERWASQAALDGHLAAMRAAAGSAPASPIAVLSRDITVYEVAASRPL